MRTLLGPVRPCIATLVTAAMAAVPVQATAAGAGDAQTTRAQAVGSQTAGQWSTEKTEEWYQGMPWLVGCNYGPATAINQLEMWQAETFDPETIDRELGWAESLGFNSIRVFLHDLPWKQDREGYLKRIEQFLKIADKHGIGVMFVLFDSVWDPNPQPGTQRGPKPGLHNSGWVQGPGAEILKDASRHGDLEDYVKGIVGHFREDKRVQIWDIWNEPDNTNDASYGKEEPEGKNELVLPLLKKTFAWAREARPTQPLTSGVWIGNWADPEKLSPMERLQLEESDVISFHTYGNQEEVGKCVENLRRYNRPLFCTEYMARPMGSTFDPVLADFKEGRVGAYNWGFVAGKTQTIYPWDSWQNAYESEPPVWFHDIFRLDGTAYRPEEVEFIRRVTGKTAGAN